VIQSCPGNNGGDCIRTVAPTGAQFAVNNPTGPDEVEAERIADQIMAMPASRIPVPPTIREAPVAAIPMQRQSDGSSAAPIVPALGSGQPLPQAARHFFEPRFGRDFGGVRIHTGPVAASSARAMGARAYTIGNHIAFSNGWFAPELEAGRRLLGHELVHVVQQATSPKHHSDLQEANSRLSQALQRQTEGVSAQRQSDAIVVQRSIECNAAKAPLSDHEEKVTINSRSTINTESFTRGTVPKVKIGGTAQYVGRSPHVLMEKMSFRVSVLQCHWVADDTIGTDWNDVGLGISFEVTLPTKRWNTYEQYYIAISNNSTEQIEVTYNVKVLPPPAP
jgi:hypothetical protein